MSRAKQVAAAIINEVWPSACVGGFVDDLIRPVIEAAFEKHMRPHQVKDRDGDLWEQLSSGLFAAVTIGGEDYEYDDRSSLEKYYGPLTEVHGDPLPDAGEISKLKERIAEKEKLSIKMEIEHDEIMQAAIKESDRQRKRIDELAGLCGKQKELIAELENDLKAAVAFDALRRATVDARDRQIAELEKLSAKLEKSRSEISSKFSRAEVHIAELEKQLAAAVKAEPAKPQPEAIWQQIGEGEWVYGVPIRGVVRNILAKVCSSKISHYSWSVYFDYQKLCAANSLAEAVEAAEKAMGIS